MCKRTRSTLGTESSLHIPNAKTSFVVQLRFITGIDLLLLLVGVGVVRVLLIVSSSLLLGGFYGSHIFSLPSLLLLLRVRKRVMLLLLLLMGGGGGQAPHSGAGGGGRGGTSLLLQSLFSLQLGEEFRGDVPELMLPMRVGALIAERAGT